MIQDYSLEAPKPAFRLGSMQQDDLLDLREQLDNHLKLKLEDIDLAEELALQFRQAKSLYNNTINDDSVAPNQKSQVLNTITSIIATITKAQADLYNAERLKRLESATLKALKSLPKESQEAFFTLYEEYLGG